MATVFDVAKYILKISGGMTAMKLQKLVYYAQAWSLAWRERPLFDEEIQAWSGGPVSPDLYSRHRGMFMVTEVIVPDGDIGRLDDEDQATINRVVEFYGKHTAQWLSDLSHLETPWRNARERGNAPPGAQCVEIITLADMSEYYSGLMADVATPAVS